VRSLVGAPEDTLRVVANDRPFPSAVVVLDEAAAVVGEMDKLAAHGQPPTPHLAFSVVLFDTTGAVLLQRRAAAKYHFAGRWSNTCCSHPRPGEPLRQAARRRIAEELAVRCDTLDVRGAFWYRAEDPASGLAEYEYDVVLIGRTDDVARPNPAEASAVALRAPDDVLAACVHDPESYTPWLPMVLKTALGPAQRIAVDVPL
jgi:isopentenyl-diphosphate delta-isomerase